MINTNSQEKKHRSKCQPLNSVLARSSKFIKTEIQKNQAININILTDSDAKVKKVTEVGFFFFVSVCF